MNKIKAFVIFCAYILAVLGGMGYLFYIHQGVITAAIAVLGVMAWPVFREAWDALNS